MCVCVCVCVCVFQRTANRSSQSSVQPGMAAASPSVENTFFSLSLHKYSAAI